MQLDYRDLLKRYMAHVGREEGATFTPHADVDKQFTAEECAELDRMDQEILAEAEAEAEAEAK